MRNLVRRYVTQEQRKAENEGVTEDDVNEIKNDISAFRFELIEIMRSSGMNTSSATGTGGGKDFCICLLRYYISEKLHYIVENAVSRNCISRNPV